VKRNLSPELYIADMQKQMKIYEEGGAVISYRSEVSKENQVNLSLSSRNSTNEETNNDAQAILTEKSNNLS
jgi:hypothetical protein